MGNKPETFGFLFKHYIIVFILKNHRKFYKFYEQGPPDFFTSLNTWENTLLTLLLIMNDTQYKDTKANLDTDFRSSSWTDELVEY